MARWPPTHKPAPGNARRTRGRRHVTKTPLGDRSHGMTDDDLLPRPISHSTNLHLIPNALLSDSHGIPFDLKV